MALVGTLFALWLGIGGGLAPLERMRHALAQRRPDDDAELPHGPVPRELRPLVDTIAHLLLRVRSTIARERRFTDDAAHELRTPLTAVKTHLQVLRLALARNKDAPEVKEALAHADDGVLRMQRTLEQLLLLARLDGGDEVDLVLEVIGAGRGMASTICRPARLIGVQESGWVEACLIAARMKPASCRKRPMISAHRCWNSRAASGWPRAGACSACRASRCCCSARRT